jgi:UDP-N-acetylglucosamine 1-carboxyvinyltransferase
MALENLCVEGGQRLEGEIIISGAKNAALPLLPLALLTDQPCTATNIPDLADMHAMQRLLSPLGVSIERHEDQVQLHAPSILETHAPYDQVRKMRASVIVLGPLLARCGQARVALPGGCAIGVRPIDLHLKAFEKMGAEIEIVDGDVVAKLDQVQACEIFFDQVTVTGTINALTAAARGSQPVTLTNCAREPEVVFIAETLVQMGATIEGIGTATMTITGNDHLKGFSVQNLPDRIEAGTFMVAAAITGGDIRLKQANPDHLHSVMAKMKNMGIDIESQESDIHVRSDGAYQAVDFRTEPYPGFPTDMQAQMVSLLTQAQGQSVVTETIFENRFMHVPELVRMGAKISIKGSSLTIQGQCSLKGAPVMATDLRASASLILAGLVAKGQTTVGRIYHLDRGYQRIEEKLSKVGARVWREKASG